MCMSCNTSKLTTRKKIILFSSLGLGIALAMYFTLTMTSNPAVAAAIPTVLAFGACPLMCAAMGGAMWFSNRLSKNKSKHTSEHLQMPADQEQEMSCYGIPSENRECQQKLEKDAEVGEMKSKDSVPIPKQQNKIYEN